jgi:hypothetical protein
MNRISRFSIAVLLVGLLVLVATGVWASGRFRGTVPPPPNRGSSTGGSPATIYMGTANFKPDCTQCTVIVETVDDPDTEYGPLPDALISYGDTFLVTVKPGSETIEVCYAYNSTAWAGKNVDIYKWNGTSWDDLNGTIGGSPKQICVSSSSGAYQLAGNTP